MDAYDEKSEAFRTAKGAFITFIETAGDGVYQERVAAMVRSAETRLIVNIDDIRKFDPKLAASLTRQPMQHLFPFQSALKEYVLSRSDLSRGEDGVEGGGNDVRKDSSIQYTVGLDGNLGSNRVSPRQLQAHHLGQLVCVEGIATRCSIVRPKVQRTVHYCEKTAVHSEMSYHDATSLTGFPTSSIYPTKDLDGNPLTTEFGLCEYADHQTLVIQEMPERAPQGLLPSSVDVVLDADLVDQCKPGDRVAIIAVYRALPSKSQGATSGIFKSVLIANHVRHLGKSVSGNAGSITRGDIKNIQAMAARDDIFELLGRSVAPSIFGHDFIKRALVLLLLGGVEKNLDNGTHIRGDINMLFVGDPSTAKSQLLRFILNIAPLALNTTGRGSSGVGLTAAVTTDKDSGERRLEAGAMVLADRGVVCIDEFDKMSDSDRVAIHEVMEQQTVTIAKAGIHMSLNARCSVVAAANPRYSQYDSTKPPNWNVNLPDSLLSRFDFLFIILDTPEAEHDRAVADKVLSNHRYLRRSGANGAGAEGEEDMEVDYNAATAARSDRTGADQPDSEVFQKPDKLLHAGLLKARAARRRQGGGAGEDDDKIFSIPFMKKYLEYAKATEPILTSEAADFIGRSYSELRTRAMEAAARESSFPITARTLETLIRLSTAHAKARLDSEVTVEDAQAVLRILRYAIEHDTGVKGKDAAALAAKTGSDDEGDDDDEQGEGDEEKKGDEDDTPAAEERVAPSPRSKRGAAAKKRSAEADADEDGGDDASSSAARSPSKRQRGAAGTPQKKARAAPAAPTSASRLVRSVEGDDESQAGAAPTAAAAAAPAAPAGPPSSARLAAFQAEVVLQLRTLRLDVISLARILAALNTRAEAEGTPRWERDEAESMLAQMERANAVMYRAGNIYKI